MQVSVSSNDQADQMIDFWELLKKNPKTLLYFYPKDNTPGCTLENKDFSEAYPLLLQAGIGVYGVSKDSTTSHCNFITKQGLIIPLISDPDLVLHKQFWSWGEKTNYGKIYQGTIRSTYLLDSAGNIIQSWENIRAKGHVERVLKELGIEKSKIK